MHALNLALTLIAIMWVMRLIYVLLDIVSHLVITGLVQLTKIVRIYLQEQQTIMAKGTWKEVSRQTLVTIGTFKSENSRGELVDYQVNLDSVAVSTSAKSNEPNLICTNLSIYSRGTDGIFRPNEYDKTAFSVKRDVNEGDSLAAIALTLFANNPAAISVLQQHLSGNVPESPKTTPNLAIAPTNDPTQAQPMPAAPATQNSANVGHFANPGGGITDGDTFWMLGSEFKSKLQASAGNVKLDYLQGDNLVKTRRAQIGHELKINNHTYKVIHAYENGSLTVKRIVHTNLRQPAAPANNGSILPPASNVNLANKINPMPENKSAANNAHTPEQIVEIATKAAIAAVTAMLQNKS